MKEELRAGQAIKSMANLLCRHVAALPSFTDPDGATGMQGWVLKYLSRHEQEDIYQRDIEAHFQIRRSTASGILRLMEQRGLIERRPVPADARLKKLVLTEKARQIQRRVMRDLDQMERDLTAGIPPEELTVFFRVLEQMKSNLE